MVVIDTNIIIDHLRLTSKSESQLSRLIKKEGRDNIYLSVISIQELYEGSSTRDNQKLQAMLNVIAPLKLLGYDTKIAELAGIIARDLGSPIELADAAIAATCIFNDAQLYTLNSKHFAKITDLELYKN